MNWADAFAIVGTAWALTVPVTLHVAIKYEECRQKACKCLKEGKEE